MASATVFLSMSLLTLLGLVSRYRNPAKDIRNIIEILEEENSKIQNCKYLNIAFGQSQLYIFR